MNRNALVLIILTILPVQVSFAQIGSANDYMETVAAELLATTELLSQEERLIALGNVIESNFDLAVVAGGVVGQHGEKMSPEQMAIFEIEFRHGLVSFIGQAIEEIGSFEVEVQAPRMRSDDRAQVPLLVKTSEQGDFEFQFSLAYGEGRWNARNLIVNGVNLGLTYRNQFNELMLSNNLNPDIVIGLWSETLVESEF